MENNKDNKNKQGLLSRIWEFYKSFAAIFLIVFAIKFFVLGLTAVSGHSMDHTLATGDIMLVNKLPQSLNKGYKRGEIVIFHSPTEPWKLYIKRVIGLPGDMVEIKDGSFYINDEKLEEDYLDEGITTEATSETTGWFVGDDEYFLVGDNRVKSNDSRNFGPVSKDNFVGEAIMRIYPLNKIKTY